MTAKMIPQIRLHKQTARGTLGWLRMDSHILSFLGLSLPQDPGAHLTCSLSPVCRSGQPQRVIRGQSTIRDITVLCKGKTLLTHEGLLPQIRLTSTLRVLCRSESGIWPAQKRDFSKINQRVLFPPVMVAITAADCAPNFPPVIRQGCHC